MKKALAASFVLLCTLFTVTPVFATALFGPQQFVRENGGTTIFNETFSATPGPARLYILNGEVIGEDRVDNVVSSARVMVNGEEIFSPGNLRNTSMFLKG